MLAETINWGQSNINLVNQKGKRLMGASSWWGTTNRQPPLASAPKRLEINVDLTPFKKPSEKRASM